MLSVLVHFTLFIYICIIFHHISKYFIKMVNLRNYENIMVIIAYFVYEKVQKIWI